MHAWDPARAAYIGTEGSGARDGLRFDGAGAESVWTDGSTRLTERYSDSTAPVTTGRLVRRTGTTNNGIALAYDDGRLALIKDTTSQPELRLTYGLFNGLSRPQRLEARADRRCEWACHRDPRRPLQLAEYDYDAQGRLTAVTRYLTPTGVNATAVPGFITTYSDEGSSTRIATMSYRDGTGVSFIAGGMRRTRPKGLHHVADV